MHRRELLAVMASNIMSQSGMLVVSDNQRQWQYNISMKDAMRDANELLTQIEIEQPVAVPFRELKQHAEECRCERCDAARDAVAAAAAGGWVLIGARQGGKTQIQLEELGARYNKQKEFLERVLRVNKNLGQRVREQRNELAELKEQGVGGISRPLANDLMNRNKDLRTKLEDLKRRYNELLLAYGQAQHDHNAAKTEVSTMKRTFNLIRGLVGNPGYTLDRAVELTLKRHRAEGYTDGVFEGVAQTAKRGLRF